LLAFGNNIELVGSNPELNKNYSKPLPPISCGDLLEYFRILFIASLISAL
jgi:hypothetical protein